MKALNLKDMHLDPIKDVDLLGITGGSFFTWLAGEVVSNWDDNTKGLSDGWDGKPYNKK